MRKFIPIIAFFLPVFVFGGSLFLSQKNNRWLTVKARAANLNAEMAVLGAQTIDLSDKISSVTPEVYYSPAGMNSLTQILPALQVTIEPEDVITAFPDPSLAVGSLVKIYRAQRVLVNDAGNERVARTWTTKIEDFLNESGLELGERDQISPALDQPILTNNRLVPVVVTITRVEETDVDVKERLDYQTVYQDDSSLELGLTKIAQKGKQGIKIKTYHLRRENGIEVNRELIKTAITAEPINEVITRGTKIKVYGTGTATWYTKSLNHVAAHNTLPRGTKVRVVNTTNGKSTVVTVVGGGLRGAEIDLSYDAFTEIGDPGAGRLSVRLEKVYD